MNDRAQMVAFFTGLFDRPPDEVEASSCGVIWTAQAVANSQQRFHGLVDPDAAGVVMHLWQPACRKRV